MKLRNNKSGFTLLEIIIVIIIVGVLASLALPKLFDNVQFSKSAEAMQLAGSIRKNLNTCSMMSGTYSAANTLASCGSLATLGYSANYTTNEWSYHLDTTTAGQFDICAAQPAVAAYAACVAAADRIDWVIDITTDDLDMTRSGTGAFAQL